MNDSSFDSKSVIVSLLAGEVDRFKQFVCSCVESFYRSYNSVKSIDQSDIVELISRVYVALDYCKHELEEISK